MLLAGVGLLRTPDLLTRMQANSKAGSPGAGLIFLGVAVYYGNWGAGIWAVAAFAFILITAPVAAQTIARAAHFTGAEMWEKTRLNELKDKYDPDSHRLAS